MTDAKKTSRLWRRMLPLLVGGVVLSMALAATGRYRALAVERDGDFIWFWIGTHSEYDQMIGE